MGGGEDFSKHHVTKTNQEAQTQSEPVEDFTLIEPEEVEREVVGFDNPEDVVGDMFDARAFTNVGSYLYYKEIRANKGVQTDLEKDKDTNSKQSIWKRHLLSLGVILALTISIGVGFYRQSIVWEQRFLQQQAALEEEMAARLELQAQVQEQKKQENQTVVTGLSDRFCLTDFLIGGFVGGTGVALSGVGPVAEAVGQVAGATAHHLEGLAQAFVKEAGTLSQEWNEGLGEWTENVGGFIKAGVDRHNHAVNTLGTEISNGINGIGRFLADLGSSFSGTSSEASIDRVAEVLSDTNPVFRICESEGSKTISCDSNSVISIDSTFFGRTSTAYCQSGDYFDTNCILDVTTSVAAQCNGLSSCTLAASNKIYGDPCSWIQKYLEGSYQCTPPTES